MHLPPEKYGRFYGHLHFKIFESNINPDGHERHLLVVVSKN